MAVLINDLFHFFWLYTVPGNVFDIVVVPLRLQLPESHRLKLQQKTASFDSSNAKLSRRAFIQPSSERQNPKESRRTLLSWKQVPEASTLTTEHPLDRPEAARLLLL